MNSDDEGLTESIPKGVKVYEFYEFSKRIISAPKESDKYSEQELEKLLQKSLVIYRMMLPIEKDNQREKYYHAHVNKCYAQSMENSRYFDEANEEIDWCKENLSSKIDHEVLEDAMEQLWSKSEKSGATDEDRLDVLFDIYEKIAASKFETATRQDMEKIL